MASQYNIACTREGYTVYRGQDAVATFEKAGDALEAIEAFSRQAGEESVTLTSTVPPAVAQMRARLASERH